jgi:beta-phosphoglucomutase
MNAESTIGVIFDMDGVLIDSAEPHFESWRLLGEECRVVVTREQFAATFGRQNRDIVPILFGEVSDTRLQALSDRKEKLYRDLVREDPPIIPGAVELVRALHEAGVRLAVGSSGPTANIDLVLGAMGVADLISVIVSGDDVTRGKPDRQVFTVACERLGLPPASCVVVEDAPAGVQAARAAGTRAVAVLIHHPPEAFDDADLIVTRLADLTAEQLASLARA